MTKFTRPTLQSYIYNDRCQKTQEKKWRFRIISRTSDWFSRKIRMARRPLLEEELPTVDALNKHLIPFIDPAEVPILHHCAKKDAPQLMDTFAKYYPSAIFLRDKYGRTLRQAELASGNKTYNSHCYLSKACTNSHGHNLQSRTPLVSEATKLERVPDSMQHDEARGSYP